MVIYYELWRGESSPFLVVWGLAERFEWLDLYRMRLGDGDLNESRTKIKKSVFYLINIR